MSSGETANSRATPATILVRISQRFFPDPLDVERELKKIEIVRVVAGLIAILRMSQIAWSSYLINGTAGTPTFLLSTTIVSALFMTIGFLTPISTAVLLLLMRESDNVLHTNTLGTSVFIQLLFVLLLARSGRQYSVDHWLLTRNIFPKRIGEWFGSVNSQPTQIELKSAYAFALIVYGTISFVALCYHVIDPYWVRGVTVKVLFVSSYLCKHYTAFRAVDSAAPWALGALSVSAGIAQSVFQFLMLPLMLTKLGRFFVKWHGTMFFLISLLFINLSFLPHWELLLWWVILFHKPLPSVVQPPSSMRQQIPKPASFFYNAYFCVAVIFIAWLSWQPAGQPSNPPQLYAKTVARAAGLEIPIVFDSVDLRMGNRWLLLYRKPRGTRDWALTHLTGLDGERLNYLGFDVLWATNHNSDLLYFGTTLPYRRQIIQMSPLTLSYFFTRGLGREALLRQVVYDYRQEKLSGNVAYRAIVLENKGSEVPLFSSSEDRFAAHPLFDHEFAFDGSALR